MAGAIHSQLQLLMPVATVCKPTRMLFLKDAGVLDLSCVLPLQVNLAVQLYPGSVAPALILGTLAGCGGRLLADGIMTGWQVSASLPSYAPGFSSTGSISSITTAVVACLRPNPICCMGSGAACWGSVVFVDNILSSACLPACSQCLDWQS
jgi:hypothetical protein